MSDLVLEGLPSYFEPIRRLGEGGMGVVWSVNDVRVNRMGALKVVRPSTGMSSITLTRFEREIRNFAQLMHAYIVQVYDVGQMTTGEPYIFMEQVDGRSICAELLRGQPFDEIMRLIDKIIEALDEAHSHHIIHRDLKPDNILVTVDPMGQLMPKLMDFGLALRANETDMRITSDGMVVGTPMYMAPEQACDEHYQICPATDFYGLGCILYELFCGRPPFEGKNAVMVMMAQAKDPLKPFEPTEEFKEMKRLAPIIHRLLEKEPDRRYETAADLRAALRKSFLIRDGQCFGLSSLKQEESTSFDVRVDEDMPFFSSEFAPKTYQSILPALAYDNYNYSVLSLRPPLFIGRSAAKHFIGRYVRDAYRCKRTAVTLITGRPGVGKTRFVESFIQDSYKCGSATGLMVDAQGSTDLRYAVCRALFKKLLFKALTPAQLKLGMRRFFGTRDSNDERVLALAEIFDADQVGTQPNELRVRQIFGDIFLQLTRSRPLILCFDNLAPGQTKQLCEISRDLSNHLEPPNPILITIINATINDMPTDVELALGNENLIWLRRGITIEPLSNSDMRLLIRNGLGVCENLARFIESLSSGLPQIAVSLARQWQLAGFLTPTEQGYSSKQLPEHLPIPCAVHQAILSQIFLTFGPSTQHSWLPVVTLAAICGKTFTPMLLAAALKYIPTTYKLITHNILIAQGLSGGVLKTIDASTLAFANPLMRDALMANLEVFESQDLHHAIARARQDLPQSFENDFAIAEHLSQAQQHYDAFHALKTMARHHLLLGELEQASAYVERAKESLKQHLGFIDARTPELVDIWFVETQIYIEKNNYAQASQHVRWLAYACELSGQVEKRALFLTLKSRLCAMQNDLEEARKNVEEAVALISAVPEPLTREQVEVKFNALILEVQYSNTLKQDLLYTARELNDARFVGRAFLVIARRFIADADHPRATRILNMAIDTSYRNNDIKTEADALHLMARIQKDANEVQLRTLQDALTCYERLAEFESIAQIHKEIAHILAQEEIPEAQIHERWSELLSG